MPRLGGLAIYGSFLIGYMLYGSNTPQMLSVLIGSFILVIMGMIDDINPLRAKYKIVVQTVSAAIVVFYGRIFLTDISAFGLTINLIAPINYIFSC